jgi:hypothetical protein
MLLVPVLWSLAIFIVAPLALDKRLHRSPQRDRGGGRRRGGANFVWGGGVGGRFK